MLKLISLIYYTHYTLVECAIYDYRVQKLDHRLIERQRQDTKDMCRIFNEDNQRLDLDSLFPGHQHNKSHNHNLTRRFKRDLEQDNQLSIREAQRVEKIVDHIYDELTEGGKLVTYRKNVLETKPTVEQGLNNTSGRRFDFAPAELFQKLFNPLPSPGPDIEGGDNSSHNLEPWPKKWPLGIVPYYIDTKTYDNELLESIRRAFEYFEKATCIRLQKLREKPIDQESLEKVVWIYITNPNGIRQCVHSNENKKNKGVQMVVLGYDCMSTGEILHEVMHVLGFPHEHTRPDRDQHVTVLWDNIKPGYKRYFEVRQVDQLMNFPYDYASVMHYPPRAFSRNGQLTIQSASGVRIGQRDGLSEIDVEKVNLVYGPECLVRNQDYLKKTCPNIVGKNVTNHTQIPEESIKEYFKNRLWPYGIVNYMIRDAIEFTAEERENIKNVIRHIEKETCLVFRDFTDSANASSEEIMKELDGGLTRVEPINPGYQSSFQKTIDLKEVNGKKVNDKNADDNTISNDQSGEVEVNEGDVLRKRVRRSASNPFRRHANHLITFVRSPANGCQCPKSGDLNDTMIVTITADCFNSANDLLHLFVHLLGLDHEHNMYDRDEYLTIVWDELPPDMNEDLENKLPPEASVGYEYDYQSVMHWPWLHVKDGVTNIIYPNWNDGWSMGHWQGLSTTDVKKLNHIYREQCEARKNLTSKYQPTRRS